MHFFFSVFPPPKCYIDKYFYIVQLLISLIVKDLMFFHLLVLLISSCISIKSKVMSEKRSSLFPRREELSSSKQCLPLLLSFYQTIFTNVSFLASISECLSQYKIMSYEFPFSQIDAYLLFFKSPNCHGF